MRGAERQYGPEYGAYTGCPADGKRDAQEEGGSGAPAFKRLPNVLDKATL